MKRTITVLLVAFFLLFTPEARATVFTFVWTGIVEGIENGNYEPASLAGVDVDDWFVATVTYDTAAFGPGVNVTGDGLDYPAPAGLQMTYQFESGGIFSKDITAVRARKYVNLSTGWGYCQWNWKGGDFGGLLFQANDWTHEAFDLPVPESFDEMHTLFLTTLSMFEVAENMRLEFPTGDPETDRQVLFTDQTFSVIPNLIADIVDFIDASIASGELAGIGPGASAPKRLNAMRNMILVAVDYIEVGMIEEACAQLHSALEKTDGLAPPESAPDFAMGPAAAELAEMIQNLMDSLGC